MRVLGVDPGLTRCGLGVIDAGRGRSVAHVAVAVVRTPADLDLSHRLLRVADAVEEYLDRFRPDAIAIERVFSQHNVRTAMGTAQAGGVVALAAARRSLPVHFHTPSEVKASVTGNGNADKAQVTAMVTRILNLDAPPKPADAADALALAICHAWRAPMIEAMAKAEAASLAARTQFERKLADQRARTAGRGRAASTGQRR